MNRNIITYIYCAIRSMVLVIKEILWELTEWLAPQEPVMMPDVTLAMTQTYASRTGNEHYPFIYRSPHLTCQYTRAGTAI